MMKEDIETKHMTEIEIMQELLMETEIPASIELSKGTYKVYTLDLNTAKLVYDKVQIYGFKITAYSFRLYYASKTAPKGFIKFLTTGLFDRWAEWVLELQERRAIYGDKWYAGMTTDYIALLNKDLTYEEVYKLITYPIKQGLLEQGITSEVAIINEVKNKFHNRMMNHINKQYASNIKELLLLFPECPDHFVNLSAEFKHLNSETFNFIDLKKEEALQYYMYKELA